MHIDIRNRMTATKRVYFPRQRKNKEECIFMRVNARVKILRKKPAARPFFSRRQSARKCNNKQRDFLEKFRRDWESRSILHDPPRKNTRFFRWHPPLLLLFFLPEDTALPGYMEVCTVHLEEKKSYVVNKISNFWVGVSLHPPKAVAIYLSPAGFGEMGGGETGPPRLYLKPRSLPHIRMYRKEATFFTFGFLDWKSSLVGRNQKRWEE